ncbi:GATA transcription factor 24 [Acorus calamus]|uniref:GATA transcription factor 24 n=1 Tax=Acorus calamus TaxID=4465 RepID=A0AAV9ES56_ACOCL|nr:GATA transcription factor 24 [Acorus calamus]
MNEIPNPSMDAKAVHGLFGNGPVDGQGMAFPVPIEDASGGGASIEGDLQGRRGRPPGQVAEMEGEQDDGSEMETGVPSDLQLVHHRDQAGVGGNQLTLSFQGEVYVFDSVSPEKVQAVLLLLGGREIPTGLPSITSSSHQGSKRSNFPQRVASLIRFREKRKERNFERKVRYNVRKEVALRMHRYKGQFASSKSIIEEAASTIANWDATQRWGQETRPEASACHHCGISAKSTPMMRRGPDGPRTLCNACGLMWATKGSLKDLTKNNTTVPSASNAPSNHIDGQRGVTDPNLHREDADAVLAIENDDDSSD